MLTDKLRNNLHPLLRCDYYYFLTQYVCFPVLHAEKQPHAMTFSLPNFTGCYSAFEVICMAVFFQCFTCLSKCTANFKPASTCFFFGNGALPGELKYKSWWLSALLLVFFEAIAPADSRSFWSSPQAVLCSSTTYLIILFTPLSKNLARSTWSWLVYGERTFSPLPDSGPTVLTGTFKNLEIFLKPMLSACFATAKFQMSLLYVFTHHEMFLV